MPGSLPSQNSPAPEPLHGFTLQIRDLSEEEKELRRKLPSGSAPELWVELRFNKPPTPEWESTARKLLKRMSCGRPVEIHGECYSHSPEICELIMAEALQSANAGKAQSVSTAEKSTGV